MADLENEYPALASDALTNPESARLLALLAKTEKVLNEYVPTYKFKRTTTDD